MDELLAQTKAELARVKGELAAREHAIRQPMLAEQKRVAQLKAAIEATRTQVNDVKLEANAVRPRGPFMTRTGSIVRVGTAIVSASFAAHLLVPNPWFALVPLTVLIVTISRLNDAG